MILEIILKTVLAIIFGILIFLIIPNEYKFNAKHVDNIGTLNGKYIIFFGFIEIVVLNNDYTVKVLGIRLKKKVKEKNKKTKASKDDLRKDMKLSRKLKIKYYKGKTKVKKTIYDTKKLMCEISNYPYKAELFKDTLKVVCEIIDIIRPSFVDIAVEFGTGNAATTGQMMGAFSLITAKNRYVRFEPNFTEKKTDAYITVEGKVSLLMLIIVLVKYGLKRSVRDLIKRYNKYGGNKK